MQKPTRVNLFVVASRDAFRNRQGLKRRVSRRYYERHLARLKTKAATTEIEKRAFGLARSEGRIWHRASLTEI